MTDPGYAPFWRLTAGIDIVSLRCSPQNLPSVQTKRRAEDRDWSWTLSSAVMSRKHDT